MLTKAEIARIDRILRNPYLDSAFSQLLSMLPKKSRAGYELCKRIERIVHDHAKRVYKRKARPSKGRHRSAKEIAARKAWFDNLLAGKPAYAAARHLDMPAQTPPGWPVKKQAQPADDEEF